MNRQSVFDSVTDMRWLTAFVLIVALSLGITTPAEGARGNWPEWYTQSLADSIAGLKADGVVIEPSVQDVLNGLGTGLDAVADLLPYEYFHTVSGCGFIELYAEYSSDANINEIGWYVPGNEGAVTQIFPGSAVPGDTAFFTLTAIDSIALRLFHPPYAFWYSQQALNFDGNPHVKFYPMPEPNTFIMFWEDLPWLSDADFNDLIAILHLPEGIPEIICTPPQTIGICDTTTRCVYYTVTQPGADSVTVTILSNGGIETRVVASGVEDTICVLVHPNDEKSIAISAYNSCGLGDICASGFLTIPNTPPTITLRDTTVYFCVGEPVCIPWVITDPDQSGGFIVDIISGPGIVDTVAKKIVVPGKPGIHQVVVEVTDACGGTGVDTVYADIKVNNPPSIVLGNGAPEFQCEPGEFCVSYLIADPDGLAGLVEQLVSAPAGTTIDTAANLICFTPPGSGTYTIIARVTDTCGAFSQDTSTVIVTANDPPTLTFGPDVSVNQCAPGSICLPYAVDDPDGLALLTEMQVSGAGVIDTAANTICFTPDTSGTYVVVARVTDQCLASDEDTIIITVGLNAPPVIAAQPDTSLFICTPQEICVRYDASDPDGPVGLIESLISGPAGAAIDTAGNVGCFTPVASGVYTFIFGVADSCNLADQDTVNVDVTINSAPAISLNNGTPVFQCQPGEICVSYSVSDPDGLAGLFEEQLTGVGTIDTLANTICFTPDTTGTYTIIARVTDPCGAWHEDTVTVLAETNQPPVISFGDGQFDVTACRASAQCLPFTLSDPNGTAGIHLELLEGIGILDTIGHQVCFEPDTSGVYRFIVQATDPCGERSVDTAWFTAQYNQPPLLLFGNDTAIFLCDPTEVCLPYTVSDPDGLHGLIEVLGTGSQPPAPPGNGGAGSLTAVNGAYIDTAGNRVCFTPDVDDTYCLVATAIDSCGLKSTDTICVTVTFNTAPIVGFGPDVSVPLCAPEEVCLPYSVEDADGLEGILEELVAGPFGATLNADLDMVCFTPDASGAYLFIVRVTDPCGLTGVDTVSLTVDLNDAPTVALDNDFARFVCGPEQICFGYAVGDPDGLPGVTEMLIQGSGTIDTAANKVCFTPSGAGSYRFIVRVTDSCGISAQDTITVNVTFNSAPSLTFGADFTVLQCTPQPICVGYAVADSDGPAKLFEQVIIAPLGATLDTSANTICFTPQSAGAHMIITSVDDSCGAAGVDTIIVTVEFNAPPVVNLGADQNIFQCTPTAICATYTVSDPNGLRGINEVLTAGPAGAVIDTSANEVCFTPPASGVYTIIVSATDSCGETGRDTLKLTVTRNTPPVLTSNGDHSLLSCAPDRFCVDAVSVVDADGNLDTLYTTTASGAIDPSTGALCFDADTAGTYCFEIIAIDVCEAADTVAVCVDVELNLPPTVSVGIPPGKLSFQEPVQLCLPVQTADPNAGQRYDITMLEGLGTYAPSIGRTASNFSHCFQVDSSGCYRFIFEVVDSCGASARDTSLVCVDIQPPDTMFQICLDTARVINGQRATVHIQGLQVREMGGFDFLVCYDHTALQFIEAVADSALRHWEYFTYRVGSSAGCFTCPGGKVRVLGFADMDNGSPHPPDGAFVPKGNMIALSFFTTQDRSFIGHCIPVGFCFEDCGDNAISSRSGDTTYLPLDAPDSCFGSGKLAAIPLIDYCNGAVCIVPPEDDRGDVNLNGLANEVGDAVLLTNYFIYGHKVWDPVYKENQILATDVNCDGNVLTVADLIYMIRIIAGDVDPVHCPDIVPKAVAGDHAAHVIVERGETEVTISVSSDEAVGGVFVALSAIAGSFGRPEWEEFGNGMKTVARVDGEILRFVVIPDAHNAGFTPGTHRLVTIPLDAQAQIRVDEVDASGHFGEMLNAEAVIAGAGRPQSWELEQNYPNPFNAGTVIRFHAPAPTSWALTIYNVLGQEVRRFSGHAEAGLTTVFWDGTRGSGQPTGSGVYFARLTAGEFTQTRKMLLLK